MALSQRVVNPAVNALAFSPDGARLAVGMFGQVVVYDAATRQPVATFRGVEETARCLAFSPDGKTLAVGCGSPARTGKALLWSWEENRAQPLPAVQSDTVEAVAYRPDGSGLLLGANDNKARYFSALPGTDSLSFDDHNGRVQAVAFAGTPDGFFVTGGADKMVKVWDPKTNRAVLNFDQAEGPITGLACLGKTGQVLGASLDGRLYGWQVAYNARTDLYTANRGRTVDAHPGGVLALAASADGKRFISAGADHAVIVWEPNGRKVKTFTEPTKAVYAVALNTDGTVAAAAGREGVVWLWEVASGKLLDTLTPPPLPVTPPAVPARAPKAAPGAGGKRSRR